MDYKNAYEEALERAKAGKPMDEVFPELKESEDEKIRKVLVDMVKRETGFTGFPSQGQVLAYLEKHKEKQPEHLELKAGHWYICHRAFCCRADHLTVKEGERFMCEKDGIVKGFVIKEPEKYFMECNAPAPMEEEQKTAEWSDEDEALIENVCTALKGYALHERKVDLDEHAHRLEEMSERLKSLRAQYNTVPVETATKFGNLEYERGVKDGIQSEKSRHWKPSEYTLSLVKKIADGEMLTCVEQMAMGTLYEQLKKSYSL